MEEDFNRINTDPKIIGGKPTIRGTKIPVNLILKKFANGLTIKEILKDYSELKKEDITAALIYSAKSVNEKTPVIKTRINVNNPKNIEEFTSLKTGYGYGIAHHGEILQGVFQKSDGHLCRGSVTLPCKIFGSEASFFPDSNNSEIIVDPDWKIKSKKAAELTLAHCGVTNVGGHLHIHNNVKLRLGFGSSTSDVIASIKAVADSLKVIISPDVIATLAVKAETASDAIAFGDRAVLFAHREGYIIEDFGGYFPTMEILGFNTDFTEKGVDTLSFIPARYSWEEIETFRPLVGAMRRAIKTQDIKLIGRVASASARINQRHLPIDSFKEIEKIVSDIGALGLQISHSGTIFGLIFDPNDEDKERKIQNAQLLLRDLGYYKTWRFRTDRLEGEYYEE